MGSFVNRLAFLGLLLVVVLASPGLQARPANDEGPPRVPPLSSSNKKALLDLFERYFEATEDDHPGILEQVGKFDPIPASAVRDLTRRLFKRAAKGLRTQGKTERVLDHPDYRGTFLIHGAKGGREKGLFIGLHGGGAGSGDGTIAAQKWQAAQSKGCICVFPTVIKKEGSAWNKEREERYVLAIIEAVKRTYRVDTNRIYLAGHSMGGFGTWSIGGHQADLFAAISPNAGGIMTTRTASGEVTGVARGVLPNLLHTPVYFTHGADDPRVPPGPDRAAKKILDELHGEHPEGYVHEYHEYPNIGHGLPPKGTTPIIKWLTSRRRNPYPKKVVWEPVLGWKKTFYWLRLKNPVGAGRLVAVNLGDNRFDVTTSSPARGLSLFLNEKMVDFKKPVTVTLNGEAAFSGYVTLSAAALLESIAERNDRKMYFTARVDLGD